jgi:hypothetical protein
MSHLFKPPQCVVFRRHALYSLHEFDLTFIPYKTTEQWIIIDSKCTDCILLFSARHTYSIWPRVYKRTQKHRIRQVKAVTRKEQQLWSSMGSGNCLQLPRNAIWASSHTYPKANPNEHFVLTSGLFPLNFTAVGRKRKKYSFFFFFLSQNEYHGKHLFCQTEFLLASKYYLFVEAN